MRAWFPPTNLCEQDGIDRYGWQRPFTKRQIASPSCFNIIDLTELPKTMPKTNLTESNSLKYGRILNKELQAYFDMMAAQLFFLPGKAEMLFKFE